VPQGRVGEFPLPLRSLVHIFACVFVARLKLARVRGSLMQVDFSCSAAARRCYSCAGLFLVGAWMYTGLDCCFAVCFHRFRCLHALPPPPALLLSFPPHVMAIGYHGWTTISLQKTGWCGRPRVVHQACCGAHHRSARHGMYVQRSLASSISHTLVVPCWQPSTALANPDTTAPHFVVLFCSICCMRTSAQPSRFHAGSQTSTALANPDTTALHFVVLFCSICCMRTSAQLCRFILYLCRRQSNCG
jgi:hypothetical protein